ncbi:hypothetical protein QBC45DRAFT_114501 [Copromyces sp. CBS 386.78]|nr:hypothetical protein QBC45DRAFT_114501 [Copromyces sp. CBS 386.78]
MANDSQDSKLSTAANIIGLLTFALSALNLVIVRVLQNERRVMEQLRKKGWKNSLQALEQKARYIQLFDPAFAGFQSNNHPSYALGNLGGDGPGLKSAPGGGLPEEGLQEILKDVQRCYDQAEVIVYETDTILHLLAEQISVAGYARATIRLLLRWDVKGFYETSVAVWRQLYNWRESRENMGTLEDNYQELSSIVSQVDSLIMLIQGIKLLPLQSTIERQAMAIGEIANTIKTCPPAEPTPSEPPS